MKIRTAIFLIPLWGISASFVCCGIVPASEVHLIPAGYQGDIFIVPGIAIGTPAVHAGRDIVFRIPTNGILVTQAKPGEGWHASEFYSIQPDGRRRRLDLITSTVPRTQDNLRDRRPIVWFERGGTLSGADLPCTISFIQYYVGSRSNLLSREPQADENRFRAFVTKTRPCDLVPAR